MYLRNSHDTVLLTPFLSLYVVIVTLPNVTCTHLMLVVNHAESGSLPGVASTVIKPQVRLVRFSGDPLKNPSWFLEFVSIYF